MREAPTKGGVKASIDLFIQFRISDPTEFVYTLGAVRGFEEKLNNAVSETIRTLVYEQEAAGIYDMVGEDTGRLLDLLNQQFRPAVELTNANITHAEPSDQRYRMDLAAPEMVRVAKEAYTHEYALQLRKEQDEGDLTRELASSHETLSAIQADIAQYQAQMDTAVERETNRADALARQRYVQAESEAKANAALLEAQALDIRAVTAAEAPEILEYRYQQQVLDTLEQVADHLPRLSASAAPRTAPPASTSWSWPASWSASAARNCSPTRTWPPYGGVSPRCPRGSPRARRRSVRCWPPSGRRCRTARPARIDRRLRQLHQL